MILILDTLTLVMLWRSTGELAKGWKIVVHNRKKRWMAISTIPALYKGMAYSDMRKFSADRIFLAEIRSKQ